MDTLRTRLSDLTKKRLNLINMIEENEIETNYIDEKRTEISDLRAEMDEYRSEIDVMNEYIDKSKAELSSMPDETQMLKLERRLESLKNQKRESQKTITQLETGIRGYRDRLKQTNQQHHNLVNEAMKRSESIETYAKKQCEKDNGSLPVTEVIGSMEAMLSTATLREDHVEDYCNQWSKSNEEDLALTKSLLEIEEKAQISLPSLEQQKEYDAEEITKEWEIEQSILENTYEHLLCINKEHQYHISRGTHVKRHVEKNLLMEEENISMQQNKVAAEIIATTEKVSDLKSELKSLKKSIATARSNADEKHKQFESEKLVKDNELEEIKNQHKLVSSRKDNLQSKKTGIMNALTDVREIL